ncbi:hypothetical protein RBA41_02040 [Massilia sp. CCM 9210]|uniref:hypothetical protein n=1 Tax=Massilia scottii TaxID=3057166 RepID=UPI002796AADC|nr:hypothetical protein [Massilia sp. CCM 9210]MDQ1812074.1 hypothetical protein [Massilia sp. CCM 9210]
MKPASHRNTLAAIGVALVLAACGAPTTRLAGINIAAASDANANSATALDIVFVYHSDAAALLPRTGPGWFDKKAALMAGLASGIDVVSLELPPGALLAAPLPPRYGKAIAVYSYANYIPLKGQAMGNLTPLKRITIRLMAETIVYEGK